MQSVMKPSVIEKPAAAEFNAYYAGYISQVTEPELIGVLASQPEEVASIFGSLDESRGTFSYAEGRWTVKELLVHIIDGERHFAHRVHRISRGDQTPIEGFEQDGYIATSNAHARTFADLVAEFSELRQANLRMFKSLSETDWLRMGTASGSPISVRALGFIMAGHVRHHVNIVKERYFA